MITIGQTLKAKLSNGTFTQVEIIQHAIGNTWWVKYVEDGHTEVTLFDEIDLLSWNGEPKKCECGATKLGHPAHSYNCDLYTVNPYGGY